MKVTIITGPFSCIPPDSIGAVEKLWYSLGDYWHKQGEDIFFVSKRPVQKTNVGGEVGRIYVKGYERTGNKWADLFLDLIYSYKALQVAPKAEIVVLNSIWSPLLYVLFKKKFKGALYNVARFPKRQLGLYRAMDCLACVSTAVYDALVAQSSSVAHIACVVPNFIDTEVFRSEKPRRLSAIPTIVYAGRIHKEKGLNLLMQAVAIVRQSYDVKLKLIGAQSVSEGGSGLEYVDYLTSLLQGGQVDWIPPIYDPKALAKEMADGEIFCYPSIAEKGETFGVAPLEAMGLGLVPIVSDLSCFKDFVEDGCSGLVFNHRVKDASYLLAKCIIRLLSCQEMFYKLSKEALCIAKAYNISSIANTYHAIFTKILNHEPVRTEK